MTTKVYATEILPGEKFTWQGDTFQIYEDDPEAEEKAMESGNILVINQHGHVSQFNGCCPVERIES